MALKHDLPVLLDIKIRKFSLYRNRRLIDIDVRPGVFCLVGANGLGKSTFLAALNFGLTGIVASPNRVLVGIPKYYSDSITYSRRFFDGRVTEDDRDEAEISLRFRIRNHYYHITRGFFEPQALREFRVTLEDGTVIIDTEDLDPRDRDDSYRQQIALDTRLSKFEYFVFVQHFLLTFDERRHALFWDERATNNALYLAFGRQPEDTVEAERLRLAIESADSNARNAQWQATLADNRLRALDDRDTVGDSELRASHSDLVEKAESSRNEAELLEQHVSDASLKASEASAHYLSVRNEYDQVFSRRIHGQRDPASHPAIRSTLSNNTCDICGSDDPVALGHITDLLDQHRCPLCNSPIQEQPELDFVELERIDTELAGAKAEADTAQMRLDRLRNNLMQAAKQAAGAASQLADFEASHSMALAAFNPNKADEVAQQRRALEAEKRGHIARRNEHRRRREELRNELEPLTSGLASAYREGELEFVPNFRRLAKRFIGLDLDISLEPRRDLFGLAIKVQGSQRRETTELSESQRFFLDIALRMALSQHMATAESPAGLFVDTPEGSLDIAYEARAGDMFADFVSDGSNLVMTANINSSQLLLRLAERCGSDRMQLVRMTDWTTLSEVQAQEEHLFVKAYREIENSLSGQQRSE